MRSNQLFKQFLALLNILFSITSLSIFLDAQAVPNLGQDQLFFDAGKLWVREKGSTSLLKLEGIGNQKAVQTLEFPRDIRGLDFLNSQFWIRKIAGGDRGAIQILNSPDGKHWHPEGTYQPQNGQLPIGFHPIGNDHYVAISLSGYADGKKASKFLLVRKNSRGVFEEVGLLDMGLEAAILQGPSPKGGWNLSEPIPFSALTPLGRAFPDDFKARTPEGLVVASGHSGYIWIIRMKEGQPSIRLVKLFPAVTELKAAKLHEIEWAILGIQPMPEGDVLIASRSEDAVMQAKLLFPTSPLSVQSMQDPKANEARGEAIQKSLEAYPDVKWWRLNLATGRIIPVDSPQNVPSKLLSPRVFSKFRFRPKLNGDLEVHF